jgi:hypothetical protein
MMEVKLNLTYERGKAQKIEEKFSQSHVEVVPEVSPTT